MKPNKIKIWRIAENPEQSKQQLNKKPCQMKKILFFAFLFLSANVAFAQKDLKVNKTIKADAKVNVQQNAKVKFSASEKAEVQKILGSDFTAVLGADGQLAIVAPKSVSGIKSVGKGAFSGLPRGGGDAANAVLAAYEKAWIYRQSSEEFLSSKLGQERFGQLKLIMGAKGLKM